MENLQAQNNADNQTIYQFTVEDINGNPFALADLKGKKVMIVNTASKCGLTPQYKELEALYQQYKDKDFIIIGFPANNFLGQEPGSNILQYQLWSNIPDDEQNISKRKEYAPSISVSYPESKKWCRRF